MLTGKLSPTFWDSIFSDEDNGYATRSRDGCEHKGQEGNSATYKTHIITGAPDNVLTGCSEDEKTFAAE